MYNGIRIQERGYMDSKGNIYPIPSLFEAKDEFFKKGYGEKCEECKRYIDTFEHYSLDGRIDDFEGYDTLRYVTNTRNSAKEVIQEAITGKNGNWEKRVEFYKIWLDLLEKRIRKIKREIKTGKRK